MKKECPFKIKHFLIIIISIIHSLLWNDEICIIHIIKDVNCGYDSSVSSQKSKNNNNKCFTKQDLALLMHYCYMSLSHFSLIAWKISTLFITSINFLSLSGLTATDMVISFINLAPFSMLVIAESSIA